MALTLAPFIHLGRMIIWPQVLLNMPLICLLVFNRRYFVASSDRKSARSAIIVCPILTLILLTGGTIRLHAIRDETSGPDSWLGCLQAACELTLVQNSHAQQAQTIQALHVFSALRIGGTSIALLAVILALRPVTTWRRPTQEQWRHAAWLIEQHGRDPVEAYALLPDKNLFFSADQRAVISYGMAGRFAVVLGDPIGASAARGDAISEFAEFCRQHDWSPLFYQARSDLLPAYRERDFAVIKIGEDACIEPAHFTLKGGEFQNLRTICNHARKQNIRFRWYDPAVEGVDEALEMQMALISRRWLTRKKGVEMTFDMGVFSLEDVRRFGAGVALDVSGMVLAFTTWRSFAAGTGRVLDLMRTAPGTRGVLDFVLVESIRHFIAAGVTQISLGNAPLADSAAPTAPSSTEGRLVRFIYENLNLVYAYKPLFEFKRKYRPSWQARYLAYPRGESLPLVGLALVRVHAPHGSWRFLQPWK
jgi:phosphatidylglycerol lysyltransferase